MAVVNRGEKYDEKEVSNKWRWEWCSKSENEERVGDYIRKIDTPGHAKCILCPAVISYGNRGLPCLANHLKSKKHTSIKASVEGNSTITGASRGEATPDPAYVLEPQLRARITVVTTEKLEPLTPVPDRVWNLEAMTLAFAAEKGLSLRTVPDLISFAQAASRDKPALEKLSMDRTTASYKLREGLAPYLQESFLEEVRGCYFSLNIDEATSM